MVRSFLTVSAFMVIASVAWAQQPPVDAQRTTDRDQVRTAESDGQNDRADRWRYRRYNGRWWYWQPNRTWTVWDGNRWNPYQGSRRYQTDQTGYRGRLDPNDNYRPYRSRNNWRGNDFGNYGYYGNGYDGYSRGYWPNNYGYGNGYYGRNYGPGGYYSPGAARGANIGGTIGGQRGANIGAAIGDVIN